MRDTIGRITVAFSYNPACVVKVRTISVIRSLLDKLFGVGKQWA